MKTQTIIILWIFSTQSHQMVYRLMSWGLKKIVRLFSCEILTLTTVCVIVLVWWWKVSTIMQLMLRLSMVNMLVKGFSFLGYCYPRRRPLHFLSSSKGNNSQLDSVLPWLLTKHRDKLSQMLEYIFLNWCSLMGSCTLHCQEVFLVKLYGSCPNQTKILTQQEKEQRILSTHMYSRM